ncbi:MAG TPA: DNA-binding response regulator [Rhodospirillaceae bacterium]|nr:DNA-binding response regulator [Candidatus Neomarinimicrobiota bacterium]HCX13681.1 DNA-binding response regulator [Rhodospirillaceae bacterium]
MPEVTISDTIVSRILVVEDDFHLAEGMAENMRAEGYKTETAYDGRVGLEKAIAEDYDLLILDVMLPHLDGFDLCSALRAKGKNTPVLFITARGDPDDRVRGLEAGGDDYLTKPFHLDEFVLRVRAILRRWQWYKTSTEKPIAGGILRFADNEINFNTFRAKSWDGVTHDLTEKEAMILKVLAQHPDEVITREDLLETVWGYEVFPSTRTVDNFILRLRKIFERKPHLPHHFLTVRGVGYRFAPKGEEQRS